MNFEEFIDQKHESHWAESLKSGDKCLATIRHENDGTKNIHNAEVIVIDNFSKHILAAYNGEEIFIPYNELKQIS